MNKPAAHGGVLRVLPACGARALPRAGVASPYLTEEP